MASRNIRLCLECSRRLNIRLWNACAANIAFYVNDDMQGGHLARFQAAVLSFAGKG
jgi:hypothetical protein